MRTRRRRPSQKGSSHAQRFSGQVAEYRRRSFFIFAAGTTIFRSGTTSSLPSSRLAVARRRPAKARTASQGTSARSSSHARRISSAVASTESGRGSVCTVLGARTSAMGFEPTTPRCALS